MERKLDTKFFTFDQNNSGGYFVIDEVHGVDEYIIIEATNGEEANDKLNKIGRGVPKFTDWCECCGPRWPYVDDEDGTEYPEICDIRIEDIKKAMYTESCFVHYIDGTMRKYIF